MRLSNLDILESKEIERLIGLKSIEESLNSSIKDLNTEKIKIWSSIVVFLLGIVFYYIMITSDNGMGWLLKIGLTIPILILAYLYLRIVKQRLRLNRAFKENATGARVFIEFVDIASMVSLYDINNFEESYDNSPAGLVLYLKNGRDIEEVSKENKRVLYIKWVNDKDEMDKLYKMFASKRTKKALNIRDNYRDELLDYVAKRD